MAFEQTERIIAVPADAVATLFPVLREQYGEELHDGPSVIRTLGGFYGDAARTVIGAASIERGSIAPTVLTDGRLAYRCLWQADLAAAFDAGQIEGVEELTEQQLADLTPNHDMQP